MITTSTSPLINACTANGNCSNAWMRDSPHSSTALSKFVVPVCVPILMRLVGGDVFGLGEAVLTLAHEQALRRR